MKVTLYKKDAKGKTIEWSIEKKNNHLLMTHGSKNGLKQEKIEAVLEGKANRSIDEQLELRMNSRISSKKDAGYNEKLEDSGNGQLGFLRPMLARKYDPKKEIDWSDAHVQRKYNGHRCLICNNGKTTAYSRNGKLITSIDHIIKWISLKPGYTVDGELYIHGESLQKISSLVTQKYSQSPQLEYHIYDVIHDKPFIHRSKIISEILSNHGPIVEAPTYKVFNSQDVNRFFRLFRSEGYEGAILRTGQYGYECGRRSSNLLKVKEVHSKEFEVFDIIESRDGLTVLWCTDGKIKFKTLAPGTMEDKEYVFENQEEFIGRMITIEFAEYTKDGIPFHPIAVCWREDL